MASSSVESEALRESMIIDRSAMSEDSDNEIESSDSASNTNRSQGTRRLSSSTTGSVTQNPTTASTTPVDQYILTGAVASSPFRSCSPSSEHEGKEEGSEPQNQSDAQRTELPSIPQSDTGTPGRRGSEPRNIPNLPRTGGSSRGASRLRVGRPGLGARTISREVAQRLRRSQSKRATATKKAEESG